MSTGLANLDVAGTIKDRIKAQFVDLIPDDVFMTMVEAEIKLFTEGRPPDRWDNNKDRSSPFQKIVQEEIQARFRVKIQEELAKPEYEPVWTNNGYDLPDQFGKMVRESAPYILEQMIAQQTTNLLNMMRSQQF